MTTVTLLRTTYVNQYLQRIDGQTVPWSDAQVNQHITDALSKLWPDVGVFATGTVSTATASGIYTIPASIKRIGRITVEYIAGGVTEVVDEVKNWRYETLTTVRVKPRIATLAGLALRFYGWLPFAVDGSTIPIDFESTVAERAAAMAYGSLAAQLANSQRQQGLDQGRVVDYQTAVGMSAYYERRYQDSLARTVYRVGPSTSRSAAR